MKLALESEMKVGTKFMFKLASALLLFGIGTANAAVPRLSSDELRRLQLMKDSNAIVIDVRAPRDFAQGHVQGARNMTAETLADARMPKDARIVVYCGEETCALSPAAADKLVALGYTNVSLLKGGFNEWLRRHYPAQTGAAAARGDSIRRMGAEEARKRIENGTVVVLDVRPALEFQAGRLPNARNVPVENLDSAMTDIQKDKLILIVDRAAQRSRQAAEKLGAAGFNVTELSGGIAGWVKRGLPLQVK